MDRFSTKKFLKYHLWKGKCKMTKNVTWHDGFVSKEMREERNGHKGAIVWLTGLSASGKSTLARKVEEILFQHGLHVYVLDGDNVRMGLNSNLGFSPEDREENIRRVGEVAKLFADAGNIVITAFISPYRDDRQKVRAIMNEDDFVEGFIKCSVEKCIERDPKGLYQKAIDGAIPEFTGISAPYEEPENAEIIVPTDEQTVEESVEFLIDELKRMKIIE